MNYLFRGNLSGLICSDCKDALSNVIVKLYRTSDDQDDIVFATADPKNTFNVLKKKQIKAKNDRLIAETKTDEAGNFLFELGEQHNYNGGVFEIDVCIDTIGGLKDRNQETIQFTITVLQPQWRETQDGTLVWGWEYCLPQRWWCYIRSLLGVWVICGQVTLCQEQRPVPGVRVFAFDRDWLQDDALGSAITDSAGYFRINYLASTFKQGTFIDVELFGGPDVYFRVETTLGAPLLVEPPARGRASDRSNVGPCFCVDLCLEEDGGPGDEDGALPFFSHLGGFNYTFDVDSAPAGSGLTNGSNRAFFSNVRLNGTLTKRLNGNPMEYRFEVRELDAGGAALGPWMQVSAGQIAKTVIGNLQRANPNFPATDPNPIETLDYVVGTPGANELAATIVSDVNGDWIQVPQESAGALSATGTFIPDGNMISLRTATLATFRSVDLVNPTVLQAGNSSTDTGEPLVTNKYFAIRMLVRENGMAGPGTQAGICQKVAIENAVYSTLNHPSWMPAPKPNALGVRMIDISELIASGGCGEINTDLTVLFTAAHPNLGNVGISMAGPGGPYTFTLPPAMPGGDHFGTATPNGFNIADLPPCAYIVTFSVQLLLTTGDSVPNNLIDQIAFCKA